MAVEPFAHRPDNMINRQNIVEIDEVIFGKNSEKHAVQPSTKNCRKKPYYTMSRPLGKCPADLSANNCRPG